MNDQEVTVEQILGGRGEEMSESGVLTAYDEVASWMMPLAITYDYISDFAGPGSNKQFVNYVLMLRHSHKALWDLPAVLYFLFYKWHCSLARVF